jgi:predicted nuclease of predicted toxin-antitoxin system
MKFLADENIEREFIDALREANFDVISVFESYIGITDDEILQIAVNEKAVILTYDTDFGEVGFSLQFRISGCDSFARSRFKFDGENRQNNSRYPQTRS